MIPATTKTKKNLIAIISSMLFLVSCTNKIYQDVRVWNYQQCSFDGTPPNQTQNGFSVELEPLRAGFYYKYPELFKFDSAKLPDALKNTNEIYPTSTGNNWIHTFCYGKNFLIALKLKITNHTNQPLNLKNTKMYYKTADGDSVMALTVLGNPELVQVESSPKGTEKKEMTWLPKSFVENDNSLISIATKYEVQYEQTRLRSEIQYPVGIGAEVIRQNRTEYKLLGAIDMEIKPGTAYSGILFFPVLLSDKNFTITLSNFPSSATLEAEKSGSADFQFRFKPDTGHFWLNKNKSQWLEGKPPATKEYFDAKNNKWIMKDEK
jgi:hypothetical protein